MTQRMPAACFGALTLPILLATVASGQGIFYNHPPAPGYTVDPVSVTADEGATVSYSITAEDKDTVTATGALEGDPLVAVHVFWAGKPPSATRVTPTHTGYNAILGTRRITYTTYTITMRAWRPEPNNVAVDPYGARDSRGPGTTGGTARPTASR